MKVPLADVDYMSRTSQQSGMAPVTAPINQFLREQIIGEKDPKTLTAIRPPTRHRLT